MLMIAAPALLHHALQNLLRRQECAGEIGGQYRVPIFFLHSQSEAVSGQAGIVHQNVHVAEFFGRCEG